MIEQHATFLYKCLVLSAKRFSTFNVSPQNGGVKVTGNLSTGFLADYIFTALLEVRVSEFVAPNFILVVP